MIARRTAVKTSTAPPRTWLLYGLPTLLLFAWVAFPLAQGAETLYLRDILVTHLPMKQAQAGALAAGYMPLIDPFRGGGQPLAGNLNAVPFYPDNLLYLAGSTLWAVNAHFWLHLLLAVPAMAWMGRAWGLGRRGAWAAGVVWAASGYFLSQLNLYNLVAGVTLTPALVAAALRLSEGERTGRRAAALGLLWALLLVAGDPLTALLALGLAAAAVACRGRWRPGAEVRSRRRLSWPAWGGAAVAALSLGTLVAAPQIVELLRILPTSFRAVYGYSATAATAASWDPRQLAEWLVPFPFGRPDRLGPEAFWGHRFTGGSPPLFFSLYPGVLALALVAASGRPRRRAQGWAWGAVAVGVFFALGRFNPLGSWLFALPGLRYPSKLWLLAAVGAALLAGVGFQRLFGGGDDGRETGERGESAASENGGRRAFWLALAVQGAILAAAWLALTRLPAAAGGVLAGLMPPGHGGELATAERLRLAGACATGLAVAALLALAALPALTRRLSPRWRALGPPLLLAFHTGSQLVLLAPLLATDAALPYRLPPPTLEAVPATALVVHGDYGGLFGPADLGDGVFPDSRAAWLGRRARYELYPFTGPLFARRYALNPSPEGLDDFYTRVARDAVKQAGDAERLRLLAAWGVDRLLLSRPLAPAAEAGARRLLTLPSFGRTLNVYAVGGYLPPATLVGRIHRAADLDGVYRRLTDPAFDPRREAVVEAAAGLEVRDGPAGEVEVVAAGAEGLAARVMSPAGGLLVLARTHLPLYRTWVDGEPVATVRANLQLLAVPVPPGEHRVEVATDRRSLTFGGALSALGLLGLALVSRRFG